ncbi:NAD(P)/FAD-dependent oxidoreductase [Chryseobacterium populi]|uniref:Thioredoxin reductase n=1 Tax=Chryseobacterium populi TaxID=1144316 RepID=J2K3Y2_9FLAO|nr:NAD(P)/FAD-dependent oxidoreductase [Chryseobacterium populi]EJL74885.1 thioredoxin reductase [Chryseobacterium populi]
MDNRFFDVIIIGGSYSGLSAGMALGRSLRNILMIDSGKPCNEQTPHSHNFLTQDGKTPKEISTIAKEQVMKYDTVQFHNGLVIKAVKTSEGFEIETAAGEKLSCKKLIVATGIKDSKPDIPGFNECWGISVIHCPYCHGYEVKNETTGILANGDMAYEFAKMIAHWTKDLTLFTNGKAAFTSEQLEKLNEHHIVVNEDEIKEIIHENGYIQKVLFHNEKEASLKALYTKLPFEQNLNVSEDLGCELNEHGFIITDPFQRTNIYGLYACGDNVNMMRSVANAVAQGSLAGVMVNKELIEESF